MGVSSLEPPSGVSLAPVTTAAEMEKAMNAFVASADLVLMAAAVADYRPARKAADKMKRGAGTLTLDLVPNPDILAGLAARRRPGQAYVGFALETSRGVTHARAKLRAKKLDLIVLNSPRQGIGGDTNQVTLVEAARTKALPLLPKREVAEHILERALELRAKTAARKPNPKRVRRAARRSR
jgi:phosphopantothenoylcysteine decarboxylase/phosphopantothenate--cysteine ligase